MKTIDKMLYIAVLGGLLTIGIIYLYFAIRRLG
ncbi:hypothetical protein C7445_102289 [Alicyclobacillus sacchari]|uniref:Uncharacterized protein n=2 Tax=Alicyclobacillus TaxID=29330 RepID=A0A1H2WPZ4_9BACL|nr:hypothetical protein C7445_102289 [Alicyclobacillus sacchari]SDW82597.1 hypothetical protein SAMN04489725_11630 [Alicyclobacillus hesperidum]